MVVHRARSSSADIPTPTSHSTLHDQIRTGLGLLGGNTAIVVASDAPEKVRDGAEELQGLGHNVWLCNGTDDHVELLAAIAAMPSGGTFVWMPGTYTIGAAVEANNPIHIEAYGAVLKLADSQGTADYMLLIAGDGSTVKGLEIDGNKSNNGSHSGRGEGLRVTADHCHIEDVYSHDTPDVNTGNCFYINQGDHNKITNCRAENAGYAGFRNGGGDFNVYQNITTINHRIKGFLHNGSATHLEVDGLYTTTDSDEGSAVDNCLIDPGEGNTLEVFVGKRIRSIGPESAGNGNCGKFAETTAVYLSDSVFDSDVYGVRIQETVNFLSMKNVQVGFTLEFDTAVNVVYADGCIFGSSTGASTGFVINDFNGGIMVLDNCEFKKFTTAAIRVEDVPGPKVIVNGGRFTGDAGDDRMLSLDGTPNDGDITVINPDAVTLDSSLTGNTGNDATVHVINHHDGYNQTPHDWRMTSGTLDLRDGGTVTQSTSKTTGVTLNTHSGQITTHDASLSANDVATFTVTNSTVSATDVIIVNQASGGTADSYSITVSAVAAGSFDISIQNVTGGALGEALVLNFAVIKGASS